MAPWALAIPGAPAHITPATSAGIAIFHQTFIGLPLREDR
jgi:hypothetical protein